MSNIPGPIVFQCQKCCFIVGDSISWSPTGSCNTVVNSLLTTSEKGKDLGSTYVTFSCRNCCAVLGIVYKSTSNEFDHLRNMFCFNATQLISYELGNGVCENIPVQELSSSLVIQEDIVKMKQVIIALNNEIADIRESLCARS